MSERHTPGGTWCKPDCPAHRAEPRWPSGPDAEQELAAALHDECIAEWNRRDLLAPDPRSITQHGVDAHLEAARRRLAALQEKRDPGE